jgi:hypothetical protein
MRSAKPKSPTFTSSKTAMSRGPIRRAQVVAPFGVGALTVVPGGTSLIGAGLDHWFASPDGETDSLRVDIDAFRLEEWRLQQALGVSHFRLPPDFRKRRMGEPVTNTGLTIPYLRFPRWHFCHRCHLLCQQPLTARGRLKCPDCQLKNWTNYLAQVPFVAMCDAGHLQDFPWREWVHRSVNPTCGASLRLIATGSATLAGQLVKCDCGAVKPRNLTSITEADADGAHTHLSDSLDATGTAYLCRGCAPWHGSDDPTFCGRAIRGSLRSASNLYFALVRSSVYLPRGSSDAPSQLITLLEQPPLSTLISLLRQSDVVVTAPALRGQHFELVQQFTDDQITAALDVTASQGPTGQSTVVPDDDRETAFRRPEFSVLRQARDDDQLVIREALLERYDPVVRDGLDRLMLVDKLRETRALFGFNRVLPERDDDLAQRKAMLWKEAPVYQDSWLPAYTVFGEGLFFELSEERLQRWESRPAVVQRMVPLMRRYGRLQETRHLRDRPLGPRFVLLHTLAHLIINRLTFECGYSTAALRERLYASANPDGRMAGVLIYTAAGDSEGTMGGLVRMGKVDHFGPTLMRALEDAAWCAADPVCMEAGARGGQGPDSCNLAACHNCSLVPETACEEFNRFLDRALVVGSLEDPSLGFFPRSH